MYTAVPQNVAQCVGLLAPDGKGISLCQCLHTPGKDQHRRRTGLQQRCIAGSTVSHSTAISQITLSSAKYYLIYSCFLE